MLLDQLLERGQLRRPDGQTAEIESIVLLDRAEALERLDTVAQEVELVAGDIADRPMLAGLFDREDVSVFHLASVVSGEGERDFDLAMRVNLDGTRNLMEAARAHNEQVIFVATSSIAVFGPDSGDVVGDESAVSPQTTYGMTKAVLELLVNEYSRKGFLDGRVGRIPTIIIRPGAANAAASSAASAIFREPLAGRPYALPLAPETTMAVLGVGSAISGLVDLHDLDAAALGGQRVVSFPSVSTTFEQMIDTLRSRVDTDVLGSITIEPDPVTQAIVDSWPKEQVADRALRLGIGPADDLDAILQMYRES
jgi:D-erythronate 2-dehydrogenase